MSDAGAPSETPSGPRTVAAVDLGSNSFHMVVARVEGAEPKVVDRLRERVRLAEGLDASQELTPEAIERALSCLSRFGERLRSLPQGAVRAAGTNTLRRARNAAGFLERAQRALGHPIEVIAGREEARLIYLGVSHSVAHEPGRRLVIDIGGGSTECILGEGFDPMATESLFMGCVSWSRQFFPGGVIRREDFRRAELMAMLELRSIERRYRDVGWESCYGSSGTVLAIAQLLADNGFSEGGITRKGLKRLRSVLCDAGRASAVKLQGLDPERVNVLPGGLAILMAAFKRLEIDLMRPASGALREGLLYDLLGRIRHEDVRERTIRQFEERYRVDRLHAARVERTAVACLEQVATAWGLRLEDARHALSWAARLHEIGLDISHTGYHRHGAYVLENADMPGFSKDEQRLLAVLVRAHRRKLSNEDFMLLAASEREEALRLVVLLRVAFCLNRSQSAEPQASPLCQAGRSKLLLAFPAAFLEESPLVRAELEEERARLAAVSFDLEVVTH